MTRKTRIVLTQAVAFVLMVLIFVVICKFFYRGSTTQTSAVSVILVLGIGFPLILAINVIILFIRLKRPVDKAELS